MKSIARLTQKDFFDIDVQLFDKYFRKIFKNVYKNEREYKNSTNFVYKHLKNVFLDLKFSKLTEEEKEKFRKWGVAFGFSAENAFLHFFALAKFLLLLAQINQEYGASFYGTNVYFKKVEYPQAYYFKFFTEV